MCLKQVSIANEEIKIFKLADLACKNAALLHGAFKENEDRKVILSFVILHRLDYVTCISRTARNQPRLSELICAGVPVWLAMEKQP